LKSIYHTLTESNEDVAIMPSFSEIYTLLIANL